MSVLDEAKAALTAYDFAAGHQPGVSLEHLDRIRAALRALVVEHETLTTERGFEYVGDDEELRRFTTDPQTANRWIERNMRVRRRRVSVPAGPWEVVEDAQ